MKKIQKEIKTIYKNLMFSLGVICMLIIGGCQSDNEIIRPQLIDVEGSGMPVYVYLNNELMDGATAHFAAIQGSDSVILKLSGVYPYEEIEMAVQTSQDQQGRVIFNGEHSIKNESLHFPTDLCYFKVDGFYKPQGSLSTTYTNPTMVKINISYTVPDEITSMPYTFLIHENSGFCFNGDANDYLESAVEARLTAESCEYICKRINSELGRYLNSLSFRFGEDGEMSFEFINSKREEFKQSFRYWVSKDEWSENSIVHIENAKLFYECVLKALTPSENMSVWDAMAYMPENEYATLYINWSDKIITNCSHDKGIGFLDDFQYKIFPYLFTMLLTDTEWSAEEKECFDLMMGEALDPSSYFGNYSWLFSNAKAL